MRIKITNLIIVSLISLSFVFSAISNANAGYSGYGGAMGNNTTGGGWTVYLDNSEDDAAGRQDCEDVADKATRKCYNNTDGGHYGDNTMPPQFDIDECMDKVEKAFTKCLCVDAHDSDACDRFARWRMVPKYTPYIPTTNEKVRNDRRLRRKQSSLNAKVDNQLAPATRAKSSRRPSPIIKARAGVVK